MISDGNQLDEIASSPKAYITINLTTKTAQLLSRISIINPFGPFAPPYFILAMDFITPLRFSGLLLTSQVV